ncbi:hypothetical protein IU485_27840 [Nocardia cyriacigeorgica]|uniref:hypothetical protein n=1 Tax=Nocardia cyriacigeorgica TaxID=135487 RepID=UPI001895FC9F|nr:hypothetical protein [Nocardia cyriacigeorgica]MBF6085190.1 hypothetical protein [Nocardia cyriacigeorgica]
MSVVMVDRESVHLLAEGTSIEVNEMLEGIVVRYVGDDRHRIQRTTVFAARMAGLVASGAPLRHNRSQAGLVDALSMIMADSFFDAENGLRLPRVDLVNKD